VLIVPPRDQVQLALKRTARVGNGGQLAQAFFGRRLDDGNAVARPDLSAEADSASETREEWPRIKEGARSKS
jgi:hypothetical protein